MSVSTIAQSANSGVTDSRAYLDNKANTLLRPKAAEGIGGFLFHVPNEEALQLSADITDHYTENNSYLNDHKILKPIIVTLSGFIAELIYESKSGVQGAAQALANRLSTVESYLGDKTPGAVQQAQAAVSQAQSAIANINQQLDKAQSIVQAFAGPSQEPTEQEKAYNTLRSLWQSSELLTVQTPWGFFDNMSILDVGFSQSGESKSITDIQVTLKELRIAETRTTNYEDNVAPNREELQSGEAEDQGQIRGEERNQSFLFSAFGGGS